MSSMKSYFGSIIKFLFTAVTGILILTCYPSKAWAQEASTTNEALESDPEYSRLKKAQLEHRTSNSSYSQNLLSDEGFSVFRSDDETEYIIRQSEYANQVHKYIEPFRETSPGVYVKEQLERAMIFYRGGMAMNAISAMEDISSSIALLATINPETYHMVRGLNAKMLMAAGDTSAAAKMGKEAFLSKRTHLLERPNFQGSVITGLTPHMKTAASLLTGNGEFDAAKALIDETIVMAETYLSKCKQVVDYDACKFNTMVLKLYHEEAGKHYLSNWPGKIKGMKEATVHFRYVYEYENNRCTERVARNKACGSTALQSVMADYTGALVQSSQPNEALNAWEQTLPMIIKAAGPSEVQEDVSDYAEIAVQNEREDSARNFLKPYGLEGAIDKALASANLNTQLEEIGTKSTDGRELSLAELREQVALTKRLNGSTSLDYKFALKSLHMSLNNAENPEAITVARELYDLTLVNNNNKYSQSVFFALETLFFTVSFIQDEAAALETVAPLLQIPESLEYVPYWTERVKKDTSSVSAELNLLYYIASTYRDTGDLEKAHEITLFASMGRMLKMGSIRNDLYGIKEFDSISRGGRSAMRRDPRDEFKFVADITWELLQKENATKAEVNSAGETVLLFLQFAAIDTATLAVARSAANEMAVKLGEGDLIERRRALVASFDETSPDYSSRKEIFKINEALEKRIPDYFKLSRPSPLKPNEVVELLGADEVALIIVPTENGTHLVAVNNEGVTWHRSQWTEDKMMSVVRDLRQSLDQSLPSSGDNYSVPFDLDLSNELFNQLIIPIKSALAGRNHLYVAASGSLSSIPFSVLVTEPISSAAKNSEALRQAAWLDKSYALIQIPSVQSLKLLRDGKRLKSPQGRRKFDGFGAPALEGKFQSKDVPFEKIKGAGRSAGYTLADISELRKLAPLSGARKELSALRRALGVKASEGAVRLDVNATETAVKSADLSKTEIIAFATHGLLAGEIMGASEPGLVFTPPETGSLLDDGYLTASEVAKLNLDASLVILSACNTASGAKIGDAGLSGLAQAFFYAGAERLLASHWPVRDDVASRVVPDTLKLLESKSYLSRAQAFGQVLETLRQDQTDISFSHPAAWAPLVLIGDR